MPIVAPYWGSNTQKVQFIADAGPTMTLQNNPSSYSLSPHTYATAMVPAQMGALYLNGSIEYPPVAIPLEWTTISQADYTNLANYFHLQPCTMIDMNDNGYYGWLKLGDFVYESGSAQQVGSCKATFICSVPANGNATIVSTLPNPGTLSYSVTTGGSIPALQNMFYAVTFFSQWGEGLPSNILSATSGGISNAIITIAWTVPNSTFYRKARVYAATSLAGLANGVMAQVIAEVWFCFKPQNWLDTTGLNGQYNTAVIPTIDRAFTGGFAGGRWLNLN